MLLSRVCYGATYIFSRLRSPGGSGSRLPSHVCKICKARQENFLAASEGAWIQVPSQVCKEVRQTLFRVAVSEGV